jgi:hypothetical protein
MERARAPACPRPYTPRRPEHSPLYRVLADHFEHLERVHEERFECTYGPLRTAARHAASRFLDCGLQSERRPDRGSRDRDGERDGDAGGQNPRRRTGRARHLRDARWSAWVRRSR